MIQESPNSILFQFILFNEILDTIVVASGVEALSIGACLCKDDLSRFHNPKSNLTGSGNAGGVPSPFRGGLGRGIDI